MCIIIYYIEYCVVYDNSSREDDEIHQVYLICRQLRMRPGSIQEWAAFINDSKQDKDFGSDQRICGIQC